MQQRQLRLGDILDDYCPRERRITNHAVVAMVGPDVKQTRCTTCDADHEYKHARVPRQRRKSETPAALYSQVVAEAPKRVAHETAAPEGNAGNAGDADNGNHGAETVEGTNGSAAADVSPVHAASDSKSSDGARGAPEGDAPEDDAPEDDAPEDDVRDGAPEQEPEIEEGPVHRPLIRATLPRPEGQPPPTRPAPDFTIRHPGGRPNRFRQRHQHGAQPFQGNRSNGNMGGGSPRGNAPRHGGGRPPMMPRLSKHQGPGRKRSK